jgi:hypothetical protein
MSLRRKLSTEDQVTVERSERREKTAYQLRAGAKRLEAFSLEALGEQLPLRFPSAMEDALEFRAWSWYRYPGWRAISEPKRMAELSTFYIALHLIDFSPLRAELVALSGISLNAAGQTPFDPVSLFLCCLLRLEKGLGWKELAKFLAGPEDGCWRRLLGFDRGHTPSASEMRHFFTNLKSAFDTDLCPRFMELLHAAGLLPDDSMPSGAPERALALALDGQLHEAHSSMRCGQVTQTCYQPSLPQQQRPCPARDKGFEGCRCDTNACQQVCCLTTPRDLEARLIHYTGSNQNGQVNTKTARNVYGYRSYAQLFCDADLHIAWVAHDSVHPANTDERTIFPPDFEHVRQRLPKLRIGEVIADAALGFKDCLDPIYDAKAIPVIVIRHDDSDEDDTACKLRGYDKNGYPLCAHGYLMSFNGLDYERLRATWACRQSCTRLPDAQPADIDCPFRNPDQPLGQIRHIQRAFIHPDGSRHERLARLYPYNSPLWKEHYAARKNAAEGRNSQLARLGLKRIWSYGLSGARADLTFADLLINLRTLGRLVQQASSSLA